MAKKNLQSSPTNLLHRLTQLETKILLVVLSLGLLSLSFSFTGDQAFFTIGALEMDKGEVLYRDFWDLKQPGIFYFYFIAGKLFGFSEIGVRLFELIYFLSASLVIQVALRKTGNYSRLSASAPLLVIGLYYSVSEPYTLTQVEMLVSMPLLFMIILLCWAEDDRKPRRQYFRFLAAGVLGGVCLLFKLMFLLIVAPAILSTVIRLFFSTRLNKVSSTIKAVCAFFIGVIIPWVFVIFYFYTQGSLHILYETFLVYPPEIVSSLSESSMPRLIASIRWMVTRFTPILAFGLIGIVYAFKRKPSLLDILLLIQIISGFGVIILQTQAWWKYHFLLPIMPLGIFAASGLEQLFFFLNLNQGRGISKRHKRFIVSLALLIFLCPLALLGEKLVDFTFDTKSFWEGNVFAYKSRSNEEYLSVLKDVDFLLKDGNALEEIYVCGNPLYYYLSGRGQATALNGWAMEFFLSEQWIQLTHEVQSARPPYIFIDGFYQQLIGTRSPEFEGLIQSMYTFLKETQDGIWYIDRKRLL